MNIRVEESTAEYVFAHWERVMVAVWRGRTTVSAVKRGEEVLQSLVKRRGEPVLLLTVVEPSAPLPPLEARMELVGMLKRCAGNVERSALVFEGEGFRAASVRAVVAGVSLFSRPVYPHRVFATVGAAARFLGAGGSPVPHLLIRAVRDMRRRPTNGTFVPWIPGALTEPSLRQR